MSSGLKVFTGNANPSLAAEVCRSLGIDVGQAQTSRFSDGEFNFQILENVRGQDCFLVQPTCPPVDQNILELLIRTDAFRRSSARRITAVIPYYGSARKDRKDKPRVPISSKLVANLGVQAGADRVISCTSAAPNFRPSKEACMRPSCPGLALGLLAAVIGVAGTVAAEPGTRLVGPFAKSEYPQALIACRSRPGADDAAVNRVASDDALPT